MTHAEAFEVMTLKNGTKAVRHRHNGEVMHPMVGPWEEANRLYVEQTRLRQRLGESSSKPLRVLDVGLGGAANACAALTAGTQVPMPRRRLDMLSLECDVEPLRLVLAEPEGFPFVAPWKHACDGLLRTGVYEEEGLLWRLQLGDALQALDRLPQEFDIVFFDPFSPEANPGFWTADAFRKIRRCCGKDAVLTTYSAATPTRVALLLAGFYVGTGWNIGLKSETTIASTSMECLEKPLDEKWLLRWQRSSARAPHGELLSAEHEERIYEHPQWARLRG